MLRLERFAAGQSQPHAFFADFGLLDLRLGHDFDPAFGQAPFQELRHLVIFHRQDLRLHFKQRHLSSKRVKEVRELDADRAGAQHQERFRLDLKCERLPAGRNAHPIGGDARERARLGAGGNEHRPAGDRLRFAVGGRDHHLLERGIGGLLDLRATDEIIDLVGAEEVLDSLCHRVGDAAAPLHDRREIVIDLPLQRKAVVAQVADKLFYFRAFEQRLGRDAAPVQARTARPLDLHTGDFFAKLHRADRTDVAGRPAANNDEVILHTRLSYHKPGAPQKEDVAD